MNILHITDVTNSNSSGVAHAVKKYLKYEKEKANVATLNISDEITENGTKSFDYKKYSNITMLPRPFNHPDLVVFNEVYKPSYIKLYKECLKNNIKYVIIPHGCLVKNAQSSKKLKKKIGNLLLFNRFIKKADAIQFLNEKEQKATNFKYKKAIISGNGVEKPSSINNPTNTDFIYIGRYDVKVKGLDILVQVCNKYRNWFIENNVKIQLYGKASEKKYEELINLINDYEVNEIIKVNGPVFDKEKEDVLQKNYCFIQLSRHEGQPMGILEALSYGIPCIVTYGTSLGEYINKNECGYGISDNIDEIFNKIKHLYENKDIRNTFAKNARKKVIHDYYWEKIINLAIDTYMDIIK